MQAAPRRLRQTPAQMMELFGGFGGAPSAAPARAAGPTPARSSVGGACPAHSALSLSLSPALSRAALPQALPG
jgi:hypothetical protein